jgi:hypothetical protein
MFLLICAILLGLVALRFRRLLPGVRKRRQQVRFVRETLAANRALDNRQCNRVTIDGARSNQQFEPHEANTAAG